jgi:hypothetical protein
MSISRRFRDLERELSRLKKQFLPKISPTGSYSDRKLSLTIAYRVLAHAEIESYLENRAEEVVLHAKRKWDSDGNSSRTLVAIVAFAENKRTASASFLNDKIRFAVDIFQTTIRENHEIKEKNILNLMLPIGIDNNDLDTVFLANMNTFGEDRGLVAHSSATLYRVTNLPDPATELNRVQQITNDLRNLDQLISALME